MITPQKNIHVEDGRFVFDLVTPSFEVLSVRMLVPGVHNIENAVAAAAIAHLRGLSANEIREGIESYRGVKRRFELQFNSPEMVYIDDYAHHPEELRACISAARALYPGRHITGIFQPHLYSRTNDLAKDFSAALDTLDELLLLPIYPARELPIAGVNSAMLLPGITHAVAHLIEKEEIPAFAATVKPGVLITMGAGDIDQWIDKIREILQHHFKSPSV